MTNDSVLESDYSNHDDTDVDTQECSETYTLNQPSTVVMMSTFDTEINKSIFFRMVPTLRRPYHCHFTGCDAPPQIASKPGRILKISDKEQSRGVCARNLRREYKSSYMRNQVSFYISTPGPENRYVNVKLSNKGLHFCGLKKSSEALELSALVIERLVDVDSDVKYLRAMDPEKLHTVISTIARNIRGPQVQMKQKQAMSLTVSFNEWTHENSHRVHRDALSSLNDVQKRTGYVSAQWQAHGLDTTTEVTLSVDAFRWLTQQKAHVQMVRKGFENITLWYEADYPNTVSCHLLLPCTNNFFTELGDSRTVYILTHFLQDLNTFEEWENVVRIILATNHCFSKVPQVTGCYSALYNSRETLGFCINRDQFRKEFVRLGMNAYYDAQNSEFLRVNIPYQRNEKMSRKDKETDGVLFMVYASGVVIISGPEESINRQAHQQFMESVAKVKDLIEVKPSNFETLKT